MVTYPYWIEHDENGNAMNYVWVKIDSIPASGTKTIFVKKEPGYSPDGESTFDFFDDFEGTSLDTNKWTEIDTGGSYSISNSKLYVYGGETAFEKITGKTYFSRPIIQEILGKVETVPRVSGYEWNGFGMAGSIVNDYHSTGIESVYSAANRWIVGDGNSSFTANTSVSVGGGVYHLYTIKRYSFDKTDFYIDDNFAVSITQTEDEPRGAFIQVRRLTTEVDFIFFRKYTSNEPTVTVTDMGSYYKVDITNNETVDLTDYQVAIPVAELNVTSMDESIEFSNTKPEQIYSYWIEHDENNNPINSVWVKIDSLPAGATKTIYAIKEPGHSPNGNEVFIGFTDFKTDPQLNIITSSNICTIADLLSVPINSDTFVSEMLLQVADIDVDRYGTYHEFFGTDSDCSSFTSMRFKITSDTDLVSSPPGFGLQDPGGYTFVPVSLGTHTVKYVRDGDYAELYSDGSFLVSRTGSGLQPCVHFRLQTGGSNRQSDSITWESSNNRLKIYSYRTDTDGHVTTYLYTVRIRKYTANEPTIQVTNMGSYYKIDITNNEATELTDYQIAIPINELGITSTTESIKFTDTNTASSTKRKNAIFYGTNA